MSPISIREIHTNLTDGSVIHSVTGELTKLWPRKNHQGNYGPWTSQGATLKDATGEIDIFIESRDELPQTLRGQRVTFRAGVNERSTAPCGLTCLLDNYKGVTKKKIKASGKAEITLADGSPITGQPEGLNNQAARQPTSHGQPHNDIPVSPCHGATVGMAIKTAVEVLANHYPSPDALKSKDFKRDVYELASTLCLMSQCLESGQLAGAKKALPPPPPPPPPPSVQNSYEITDGESDIPF